MISRIIVLFWCGVLFFSTCTSATETLSIPDALKPWVPWVLKGEEKTQCPFISVTNEKTLQHLCAWPGTLNLEVQESGAVFKQKWQVFAKTQIFLPTALDHWPVEVLDNGQSIPVLDIQQKPGIWLSAGEHVLEGRFTWPQKPQSLILPEQTALVSLTDNGNRVLFPNRTEQELWLNQTGNIRAEDRTSTALKMEVYRNIADGIPLTITTQVKLDVSGEPREEVLGKLLFSNFIPMQFTSALPGRIEPDGRLRIQLRSGTWDLQLVARQKEKMLTVPFETSEGTWAAHEVWSYSANHQLRSTEVTAGKLIDPKQAGVPTEWQSFPSFRMVPLDQLHIKETSRGMGATPSQLRLNRDIWLDFDGLGFTVKDKIEGQLNNQKRLDMKLPYALKQVTIGAEQLPVTRGYQKEESGVETRKIQLDMESIARINEGPYARIPATGWQQEFQQVTAQVHLPPGYHLLTALQVDRAEGSWLERWTLLDWFLVLFTALVASQLLNRLWGLLTLIMLVIFCHETGMHFLVFLNLFAALALFTYLPEGIFKKILLGYGTLSFIAILIMVLPFSRDQIRLALHPQLELPSPSPIFLLWGSETRGKDSESFSTEIPIIKSDQVVQNSAYLPEWRWNEYALSWNGAVSPKETMRLIMMPRWFTTLMRLMGVLLLLGIVGRLGLALFRQLPALTLKKTLLVVLLGALWGGIPGLQQAVIAGEIPTPELLGELKKRLIEPPDCVPTCVAISAAAIQLEQELLTIRLTVQSAESAAVALPGGIREWLPEHVFLVDPTGNNNTSLSVSLSNQALWVPVIPGVQTLVLQGPVTTANTFQLSFPMKPLKVTWMAPNWEVTGVQNERLLSNAVSFKRKSVSSEPSVERPLLFQPIPAFVQVERMLNFSHEWRVTTTITRKTSNQEAIHLQLPLLPGEAVVTPADLKVENHQVYLSLSAEQQTFEWESVLKKQPTLILTAPKTEEWTEIWRFRATPEWHVEYKGFPAVESDHQFMPWPGETLTVQLFRPEILAGPTLTIENTNFESMPGNTSTQVNLQLSYRSTMGGHHRVDWPETLFLQEVKIDGATAHLKANKGVLVLPILPGRHQVEFRFQQPEGIAWWMSFPTIHLNTSNNNTKVMVNMPNSRWIWWVGGPRIGPAVLYWGELLLFFIIAIALTRTQFTPLKVYDWILLGLGVSMTAWSAFLWIALWLFALAYRARTDISRLWVFNTRQVLLGCLTVAVFVQLIAVIPHSLLGNPDMHIVGNQSTHAVLQWFQDYQDHKAALPQPWVISLPIWAYRTAMLLWSLWFAFSLIRWIKWGWGCISQGGWWRRAA